MKIKNYLIEYWKLILISVVIFISTATTFYFIGDITNIPETTYIYYQDWFFLQDDTYEGVNEPVFCLCANFSENIQGKKVEKGILNGTTAKYYSFNISAIEGNLSKYSVGIFFNDAYAIQLWIGHSDGAPQPIDPLNYDMQFTTLYKEDFMGGVFIYKPLDGSSLEEYHKVKFYVSNIYYSRPSIYEFQNFYYDEFDNMTSNFYINIQDISRGINEYKPDEVIVVYSINKTEEISEEMHNIVEINQRTWQYKINIAYELEGTFTISFKFTAVYNFDNFMYPFMKVVIFNISITGPPLSNRFSICCLSEIQQSFEGGYLFNSSIFSF